MGDKPWIGVASVDASFLGRIMDGNILGVPRRYVAGAAVVCAVKLLMAATLYIAFGMGSTTSYWMDAGRVAPQVQNEILTGGAEAPRWTYLFLGWDSAWYASIAAYEYSFSDQSFAFMPGFPLLTGALQPLLGGVLPALAIISLVAGVLWVPVFESVAEHYTDPRRAFVCTLLFALSPFTLLFTTVSYTEGLFLLLTLAAWRLYLDGRYSSASVAAALASLVRIPGFLIVLPMFADMLGSRRVGRRRALLVALPTALALLLWGWVSWLTAGDPLAMLHNSMWSGMYTLPTWLVSVLPGKGIQAFSFPVPYLDTHPLLAAGIWVSAVSAPVLAWRLRRVDARLTTYCLVYLLGVLAFGAAASLPRFIAVLFPLWLSASGRMPGKWPLAALALVSVALSLVLWAGFIDGLFVG